MASDLLSSSLLSNSHTVRDLDKLSVIFRILSSIAVGYTFNENWFAASTVRWAEENTQTPSDPKFQCPLKQCTLLLCRVRRRPSLPSL